MASIAAGELGQAIHLCTYCDFTPILMGNLEVFALYTLFSTL